MQYFNISIAGGQCCIQKFQYLTESLQLIMVNMELQRQDCSCERFVLELDKSWYIYFHVMKNRVELYVKIPRFECAIRNQTFRAYILT